MLETKLIISYSHFAHSRSIAGVKVSTRVRHGVLSSSIGGILDRVDLTNNTEEAINPGLRIIAHQKAAWASLFNPTHLTIEGELHGKNTYTYKFKYECYGQLLDYRVISTTYSLNFSSAPWNLLLNHEEVKGARTDDSLPDHCYPFKLLMHDGVFEYADRFVKGELSPTGGLYKEQQMSSQIRAASKLSDYINYAQTTNIYGSICKLLQFIQENLTNAFKIGLAVRAELSRLGPGKEALLYSTCKLQSLKYEVFQATYHWNALKGKPMNLIIDTIGSKPAFRDIEWLGKVVESIGGVAVSGQPAELIAEILSNPLQTLRLNSLIDQLLPLCYERDTCLSDLANERKDKFSQSIQFISRVEQSADEHRTMTPEQSQQTQFKLRIERILYTNYPSYLSKCLILPDMQIIPGYRGHFAQLSRNKYAMTTDFPAVKLRNMKRVDLSLPANLSIFRVIRNDPQKAHESHVYLFEIMVKSYSFSRLDLQKWSIAKLQTQPELTPQFSAFDINKDRIFMAYKYKKETATCYQIEVHAIKADLSIHQQLKVAIPECEEFFSRFSDNGFSLLKVNNSRGVLVAKGHNRDKGYSFCCLVLDIEEKTIKVELFELPIWEREVRVLGFACQKNIYLLRYSPVFYKLDLTVISPKRVSTSTKHALCRSIKRAAFTMRPTQICFNQFTNSVLIWNMKKNSDSVYLRELRLKL